MLERKGIKVFNLQNAPSNNIHYKIEDHITLSTIYKAKGNEAGSIYIVGIDAVFIDKDDLTARNKIFTAITRSKGWVTLTGIKPYADFCKKEVEELFEKDLKLVFKQPSEEDVVTIKQDISEQQRKLNEMERIANELKKLGLSEDEIKEKFLNRFLNEKQ
ncbi:MAG: ATP-binding domain-containing protein [Saprospiraceae bacterium]|nr:ATP-binding domain-containing protein [Saprospiraceae bacterium]